MTAANPCRLLGTASMPYTPPAQQSPVASRPESPTLSRNHSYVTFALGSGQSSTTLPRPALPRSMSSTSYLHKHRRSPSVPSASVMFRGQGAESSPQPTPPTHSATEPPSAATHGSSVRQSPPPLNDLAMPTGAVISPPDSSHNSSDDEELGKRVRERSLENLAELQAAISIIEQRREGSPDRVKEESRKARMTLGLVVPEETSGKPGNLDGTASPRARFSSETRKIQHSRSATESSVPDLARNEGFESPDRSSDSDLEEEARFAKPPMLRKKSGELVRPALRPTYSKRRPSSMPGTPTYSKAVHFDSHLEHVRHFLQVDRPLAVSANTSPTETFDGDMEFPFGTGGRSREPAWQWEMKLPNFPRDSVHRTQQLVHVERVFLSSDGKTLVGAVAVHNISFQKQVVIRFTLDDWKTTSEVTAEYNNDVHRPRTDSFDRFNFNIKLEDLANLENKTLLFCVRYTVNGQDFWDSNGNVNFQVNFAKKAVAQNGKQGLAGNALRPLNALPRSRPSLSTSSGRARPKSAITFDDFAHGFENQFTSFPPPASAILNDTPIRFRNRPSDEATSAVRTKAPTQAFGNRYDFGASLSAAIQAASTALGDGSGLQVPSKPAASSRPTELLKAGSAAHIEQRAGGIETPDTGHSLKPAALTSEKPALKSQSYNELLDKYCFFGSGKFSPLPSKPENGQLDGSEKLPLCQVPTVSEVVGASPVLTPPVQELKPASSAPVATPRISRSSSPVAMGSRAASPVFGYPYHQVMQNSMFSEAHTQTAIRG